MNIYPPGMPVFEGAESIDASHSTFNNIEGDQFINIHTSEDLILDKLPRAKKAPWDYIPVGECLEGTRIAILDEIKGWISNGGKETCQVFWLNGRAGTGKTTIAKSVAHFASDEGKLGASFFCSRYVTDQSDQTLIFPTLAFQLSELFPQFRIALAQAILKRRDIGDALALEQFQKLIITPLQIASLDAQSILIIIDALDECHKEAASESSRVLEAIFQLVDKAPNLKVFVTSRPELALRRVFYSMREHSNVLDLHQVEPKVIDGDIRRFLTARLTELAQERCIHKDWPPPELMELLVHKTSGLFIFGSTLCKFVGLPGDPRKQLQKIVHLSTSDHEGRLGINQLYQEIVASATVNILDDDIHLCRSILGTIILLRNPLSVTDLSQILRLTPEEIDGLLMGFHSVLAIPRIDNETGVIHMIHSSFHDFMTNEMRCLDTRLLVDPALQHGHIAMCLFEVMARGLGKHVYEGMYLTNCLEDHTDGSLAYACRYWADHLAHSAQKGSQVNGLETTLDQFARSGLVYWIETLEKLGSIGVATTATDIARTWLSGLTEPQSPPIELLKDGLAVALITRFAWMHQNKPVSIQRGTLKMERTSLPVPSGMLDNVLKACQKAPRGDVEAVTVLVREALGLQPAGHPNTATSFRNVADALSSLFKLTGELVCLNESVRLYGEVLQLQTASHPDRSSLLDQFASALEMRSHQTGQSVDLDDAVRLHREALQLRAAPHPDRPSSLNNLAFTLLCRFSETKQITALDEAVTLLMEALQLLPTPHPDRSSSLNHLGIALRERFFQNREVADVHAAVSLCREALELRPMPHPERSTSLRHLAVALWTRFGEAGSMDDLEDAIQLQREALQLLPKPHPDRERSLSWLSIALHCRFEQTGLVVDLDEAISLDREALQLLPASHTCRAATSISLANGLLMRSRKMLHDDSTDLDEAVMLYRDALRLKPENSSLLNGLGAALWAQFYRTHRIVDLDDAIVLFRKAVRLLNVHDHTRPRKLFNIASALHERFRKTGQMVDINDAISLHREALSLSSATHANRWSTCNNLAFALQTRFCTTGTIDDLNDAVSLYRDTLRLCTLPKSRRSMVLSNLADTLSMRFGVTGQINDQREATALRSEVESISETAL